MRQKIMTLVAQLLSSCVNDPTSSCFTTYTAVHHVGSHSAYNTAVLFACMSLCLYTE